MEFCCGLLQSRASKMSSCWIMLAFIFSMLSMQVHCWSYFYSNTTMNWANARAWCQEHYTDMVAIQNQEEISHLNTWLPKKNNYYWIGIRKINGTWTWVGTNKSLTAEATNWAQGEPNNGMHGKIHGNSEDCVEMYIKRSPQPGKWNDERCSKKKTALCYTAACQKDSCVYGDCVETINSHKCQCFEGFYGDKCEYVVQCNKSELTLPHKGSVECTNKYGEFTFDSLCQYSCEEGYQLSRQEPLRCTATKNWSQTPPTCQAVQCPALLQLDNGTVSCEDDDPDTRFSYGGTCTFSCDLGYRMVGPSEVTCTSAARWSDTMPRCEAITCPAPEVPKRGHVNCTSSLLPSWGSYLHNTVCTFSCDEGHELRGASNTACTLLGEWNVVPPTCIESTTEFSAITAGATIGGAVSLSTLSVVMWILRRMRKKATKFELNSNSDIEDPPQVYKNSIDSLI
ncbi:E-selectin [Corythoichthys intestinalis]|uniref:E-selectin n=1 Tax=Corythoichthys intestinalis TaxID=161448 RepID=UPI0025A5637A|nr:E-selectin [Corythoichthys intestinalis]